MLDLIEAAKEGDLEKVKLLINHEEVTEKEAGRSIVAAVEKGHKEIIELLIDHEKITEEAAYEAILEAIVYGHKEIVELLVNHEKITVDGANWAISEAAENGHKEMVELLIDHKKVTEEGVNNVISVAAGKGHKEIVKLLIEHKKVTEEGAKYAISEVARKGRKEMVELLIDHKKVTEEGAKEAIGWAAKEGNLEIVKLLIDHEKVTEEGAKEAISVAVRGFHVEIEIVKTVKLLISYGISFDTQGIIPYQIRDFFTPIKNDQEIISSLLEKSFTDVKDFAYEQKEAFSHEESLVHIIARYFNPKIFNNSTEENKEIKRETLLNLVIANPHIQFDKLLTSNPHLIKFLSIYVRDNECSHKSEVIEILFNAASCLIQNNLSIIEKSAERVKELNQEEYEDLSDKERKEIYCFEDLKELNNQLEEDKKGLETNEVFNFRNKLKARNKFSDIEIITSPNM